MAEARQKPVRVEVAEVNLVRCPVCGETITATVEVEVHLGEVTLGADSIHAVPGQTIVATASASTRVRSLTTRHECRPEITAADQVVADHQEAMAHALDRAAAAVPDSPDAEGAQ